MRRRFQLMVSIAFGFCLFVRAQSVQSPAMKTPDPMPILCESLGGSLENMGFWKGRLLEVSHFTTTPEGKRLKADCQDELAISEEGSADEKGPVKGQPERWLGLKDLDHSMQESAAAFDSARAHGLKWPVHFDRMDLVGPFLALGKVREMSGANIVLSARLRDRPLAYALFSLSAVDAVPVFTGFAEADQRGGMESSIDISPSGRYALFVSRKVRNRKASAFVEDLMSGKRRRVQWTAHLESGRPWRLSEKHLMPGPHWTVQETLVFLESSPRYMFLQGGEATIWIPPLEDDPVHWPNTVYGRLPFSRP